MFVLYCSDDYEGSSVLGVYSTALLAELARQKYVKDGNYEYVYEYYHVLPFALDAPAD